MLVSTATCPPHGPNIIAIKHVLHGVHAQKTIVVRAVMAMEIIISVLELQESHVRLRLIPSYCEALDWIVQSIVSVPTLSD